MELKREMHGMVEVMQALPVERSGFECWDAYTFQ